MINLDLIITDAKAKARFLAKLPKGLGSRQCWEWQGGRNDENYGEFALGRERVKAHRVSYTLFNGTIPDGLVLLHKCDNPPCCNPHHLTPGTQGENCRDKEMKGRGNHAKGDKNGARLHPERLKRGDENSSRKTPELLPRGKDHWTAKNPEAVARGEKTNTAILTDSKVADMRAEFRAGASTPQLALKYGVDAGTAWFALRGKTWAHVPDPIPEGTRHQHHRARGERVNTSVLTAVQVLEIRRDYKVSPTHKGRGNGLVLAAKYGVPQATISAIVTRKSWKHLP